MNHQFVMFLLGILFSTHIMAITDLPPGFPRCKRTDPKMEECLIAATNQVRPYIIGGIPDFLPPLENFTVPKITLEDGKGALNFKAELINVTLMGLEKYKFTRYNFDVANKSFLIKVEFSHLYLKGKYVMTGQLLLAPIKGDGDFHGNISKCSCSIYHTVDIVNKHGIDYLKPQLTTPKIDIGKITDYGLVGLFKENKDLERATQNIIKNNLNVIVEEMLPAIEKVLGAIFDKVIFKSVTKIPYNKLYPE
ncbi:unnamed protein product [Phaedon cochleariae]|uniref:Protein takeout-like n=1 Tax=Phaedon cochleariae TaxID=80249 RepID=A0A9P0GVJ2_PHACE|nr:unnamed protein product [Phaedon cochleariae]